MMRRILVASLVLMTPVAGAYAQTKIQKAPIQRTSASDAQAMYSNYCAVCHGKTGVGDGPAAKALTKAPADLTKLAANNKGSFPEVKVKRYIEGADEVAAHGTRDMPMWGTLFRSLDRDTAALRVQALSDYLKGMQSK